MLADRRHARRHELNALKITLRVYFDGSATPNVEVPLAPFFGIHHGCAAKLLNSPYLQVTDQAGFNSYFPTPLLVSERDRQAHPWQVRQLRGNRVRQAHAHARQRAGHREPFNLMTHGCGPL